MNKVEKDIRDAIWQYFIDHSRLEPSGFVRINFGVEDEEDFWRRVQARKDGEFFRNDVEKMENEREEFRKIYQTFLIGQKISKRNAKRIEQIKSSGSLWERLLLRVYWLIKKQIFTPQKDEY